MSTSLLGKFILNCHILCKTGLHIGGTAIGMEIGGVDNPVIKDPLSDTPMIPGSSLKGKLRSLTEWHLGLIAEHEKHKGGYQAYACKELKDPIDKSNDTERWERALVLARLFGPATDDNDVRKTAGPSRLIVRDAFLTEPFKTRLQNMLGMGLFTELKYENALDRVTAEANPRPIERVPAGSEFELTLILDCYEESDKKLFRPLFTAMSLLEHSSLGGGGSRGNGQIAFDILNLNWRSAQDYEKGETGREIKLNSNKVDAILKAFDTIEWPQLS